MIATTSDLNRVCLIILSFGLLVLMAGLVAPVATLDQLFLDPDTYSIIGSISNLLSRGDYLLALLIGSFSVLFPVLKYCMLLLLVLKPPREDRVNERLQLLRFLGKWSMLDVFVTAITFGAANLGVLSEIEIHWGIYLYGTGIFVSMFAALVMSWSVKSPAFHKTISETRDGLLGRSLHALAFLCFLAGMTMPLVQVEKWLFWENHYSVLSAMQQFIVAGEYLLPIMIGLFVILLPLIRFMAMAVLRWKEEVSDRLVAVSEFLDEWAMFDVYMLAMLLVMIKLGDRAAVTLQAGFWLLLVAAAVSILDSLRVWLATNRQEE